MGLLKQLIERLHQLQEPLKENEPKPVRISFNVALCCLDNLFIAITFDSRYVSFRFATEPKMFFDPPRYSVDESVGKFEVTLRRNGTDLSKSSTVFVRSRQTNPISATGNKTTLRVNFKYMQMCARRRVNHDLLTNGCTWIHVCYNKR